MRKTSVILLVVAVLGVVAILLWLQQPTAVAPIAVATGTPMAPSTAAAQVVEATATRTGPTGTPTLSPDQFANPVINLDFPDPDILQVGNTYYAYATNAGPTNIQMASSTDLVHWKMLGGALPALPFWAKAVSGLTWAPEVTTGSDANTFVMYYTSRDEASDKQCIGVATATSPEGPFRSVGTANEKAFICQPDEGGSIDAASFTDDDGTRYLLWKNDGNCCGVTTYIYIQRVSADGLTLEGEPTQLIKNDLAWEGNLVEGPTLWKQNGKYYLFYSANAYNNDRYAVGYAVADSILGPYVKNPKPFMATDMKNGGAFGPGGQDIVEDKDGELWMAYHSWDPLVSSRWMQIDPLMWEGDTPVINGPKRSPQSIP
jgi:arabinan endo-1,5-alpha-L-arabinosidase